MDRIEKLMRGAIDLHIHPDPSLMERSVDSWEAAEQAAAAGMRAILLKDHHVSTAPHAYLSNKHLKTGTDFQAFGSICLNNASGGLNPFALDAAIKLGIKLVYFPTISAHRHIELFTAASRRPEEFVSTRVPPMSETPITILDGEGAIKPVVKTLIDMIADAGIILATGHLDYDETLAAVEYAKQAGVKKICLTHLPMFTTMDKAALKKIVDIGGVVEFTYQLLTELTPAEYRWTPEMLADYIRFFGVENCLFSTDFGHISCPVPVEGMRMSIRLLIDRGFSDEEISILIRHNPAKLLGIE